MEFRILGALEVVDDGRLVTLGGGRQRALLAVLLLHRNEVVTVDRLIDDLWADGRPETAANVVQVYVSRLRKALQAGGNGDGVLRTDSSGYLLRVEGGSLDVDRFERLADDGRAALSRSDPDRASALLGEALALWRGAPLSDFTFDAFAQSEISRLDELRLAALEDRIDADLARGRHSLLVGELEALVAEHPLRERLRGQLMLALYRSERQAEALDVYRLTRQMFVEELGIEPGPALKELEHAILLQEGALEGQSPEDLRAAVERPPARVLPARPRRIRRRGTIPVAVALVLSVALGLAFGWRGRHSTSMRLAANSVGFVDAKSGRVTLDYAVGDAPTSLAVAENYLWVANFFDRTVTRIARGTGTAKVINVEGHPSGIVVFRGTIWVWTSEGLLEPIDPRYGVGSPVSFGPEVARQIKQFRAIAPDLYRVSPSAGKVVSGGGFLWLTLPSALVIRVNPARPGRARAFTPNDGALGAIGYSKGKAWIAGYDRLFPISSDTVVPTEFIRVGQAHSMTFGAGSLWVLSGGQQDLRIGPALRRVDVDGRVIDATIPLENPVAVAWDSGSIWVVSGREQTIRRVDPADNTVVEETPLGARPTALAADRDGVWVTVR